MVDTGVSLTPDTQNAMVVREALDGSPDDDAGRGTLLAQALAGPRNNWGSLGMWPHLRIASVRVTDSSGQVWMSRVARGIDRCRELGVSVIEIALTGPSATGQQAALQDAVNRARAVNIVVRRRRQQQRRGGRVPRAS